MRSAVEPTRRAGQQRRRGADRREESQGGYELSVVVNFDDVVLTHGYEASLARFQSKLAMIAFSFELVERLWELSE